MATSLDTLELTKIAFLEANKAVSDYQTASPEKKRDIIQNLLWNLEVKDKSVAKTNYKLHYAVMANAPKNGDLATMLADGDSNFQFFGTLTK